MLGLKRGTVQVVPHQTVWNNCAQDIKNQLSEILGATALDIQHVGSTAILGIYAKPILDIAVGVASLKDISPYIVQLEHHGIVFRGQDVREQMLFVMGDFENNTRTHHIHVVKWNSPAWNDYLDFRDYLNAFPEKAKLYDRCKQKLASQFPNNRDRYTQGKRELIDVLLREARIWRIKANTQRCSSYSSVL